MLMFILFGFLRPDLPASGYWDRCFLVALCHLQGVSQALFDLGVFLKLSLIEKKQWIV